MTRRGLFGIIFAAPLAKFFPKKKEIALKAGDFLSVSIGTNPNHELIMLNTTAEMLGRLAAEKMDRDIHDWWVNSGGLVI